MSTLYLPYLTTARTHHLCQYLITCLSLSLSLPPIMAGKRLYPRATFKRILKSNTKMRLSKNVDILVFLDYVLFMEE